MYQRVQRLLKARKSTQSFMWENEGILMVMRSHYIQKKEYEERKSEKKHYKIICHLAPLQWNTFNFISPGVSH